QREVFQLGGGGVERRVGVLLHVLADLLGVLGALGRPLRERLGAAGRVRDDRGQRLRRGGVFDGPVFVGRGGERRTHQRKIHDQRGHDSLHGILLAGCSRRQKQDPRYSPRA